MKYNNIYRTAPQFMPNIVSEIFNNYLSLKTNFMINR